MGRSLFLSPGRKRGVVFAVSASALSSALLAGAQRIHDSAMLLQRIKEKGVPPGPLMDYVNAFSYGAFPHAGWYAADAAHAALTSLARSSV